MVKKTIIIFCFLLIPAGVRSLQARPGSILLVHSYHPEYPWVASITEGVREGLKGSGMLLDIFYMDTKRKTSPEWITEAGSLARIKIATEKPSAVITADDNALIHVAQQYVNKKPWFVFCGVNGNPEECCLPASNMTGIVERPHVRRSIALLRRICPSAKRIVVMSDKSITSLNALRHISSEASGLGIADYRLIDTFSVWKKRIKQYNSEADALCIYMYHTLKREGSDESVSPKKVMAWTIQNCSIPTVGFFDFSIYDGMLCGVVESGQEHGREAAKTALALLAGKSIKSLPVRKAVVGTRMINMKTAQRLGHIIPEEITAGVDIIVR